MCGADLSLFGCDNALLMVSAFTAVAIVMRKHRMGNVSMTDNLDRAVIVIKLLLCDDV